MEEVQQILRELRMRQAIYDPVFEGPDLATLTAGMKAKFFTIPSTWCGMLISMVNSVMG